VFTSGQLHVSLRWMETGTWKNWITLAHKSFFLVVMMLFYLATTYDE